jgi:hypothetical protein
LATAAPLASAASASAVSPPAVAHADAPPRDARRPRRGACGRADGAGGVRRPRAPVVLSGFAVPREALFASRRAVVW